MNWIWSVKSRKLQGLGQRHREDSWMGLSEGEVADQIFGFRMSSLKCVFGHWSEDVNKAVG